MRNILFVAGMLVTLAACNNNEMENQLAEGPVKMGFTASIKSNMLSQTSTASTNFSEGDKVGIVPVKGEAGNMEVDTEQGNTSYTYGADGKFAATTEPYYFMNLEEVDFHAYFPYKENLATDNYTIAIQTDAGNQTTEADNVNWRKNDILYASASAATARQPQVSFTFQHVMSMFTLTLKAGDGITDFTKLASYTIGNIKQKGSFSLANGTLSLDDAENAANLTMPVSNASGTELECTPLILLPQAVGNGLNLTVKYDGQDYSATLALPDAATELEGGMNYKFTVTLKKSGLKVESSSIKPWTYKTGTGEATLKPQDPYRVLDPGGTSWMWLDMEAEDKTPELEDSGNSMFYIYSGIHDDKIYNNRIDEFTSDCFSLTTADCPWTSGNESTKYVSLNRTEKWQYMALKFTEGKYTDLSRWSRFSLEACSGTEAQSLNMIYFYLYDKEGNLLSGGTSSDWTWKCWKTHTLDLTKVDAGTDLSKVAEIRIAPNGHVGDSGNIKYYFDNIRLERDTDLGVEEPE